MTGTSDDPAGRGPFADRVYIVTGASRGIGLATVRALVGRGAKVAMLARNPEILAAAAAEIGPASLPIAVDVGERAEVFAAFDRVASELGRLDGVVNNVGANFVSRVEFLTEAWVMAQVRANFLGVVYGSQAAIPHLRRSGGGRIVNVGSATVRHPDEFPFLSIYAATKAAAVRFTEELRREVRQDGIGVTLFSPGSTETTFGEGADPVEAQTAFQAWLQMGPNSDGLLDVDTVGGAIADCFALPPGAAFDFVELRPNRPTPKMLRI
jgi:NAD(P)-dependent dehydrogenase (short-subunit alcohol dehydrogenase family)